VEPENHNRTLQYITACVTQKRRLQLGLQILVNKLQHTIKNVRKKIH